MGVIMAKQTKQEYIDDLYEELALWRLARKNLVSGGVQSYTIHNRQLTYLDLAEINRMIKQLQNEIDQLESGRRGSIPVMPVVFRDF